MKHGSSPVHSLEKVSLRGRYRISPRGERPVMDWCLNAVKWCILNGDPSSRGWAPAPVPPPGSAPDPGLRSIAVFLRRHLTQRINCFCGSRREATGRSQNDSKGKQTESGQEVGPLAAGKVGCYDIDCFIFYTYRG